MGVRELVVLSIALAGCAGEIGRSGPFPLSTTSPRQVLDNNNPGSGIGTGLSGFLGRSGVGSTAPTDPLPNFVIVARGLDGKEVARTTTGPDGAFQFPNLPAGLAILDFTSFQLPATVVNGTEVTLGRVYPVDRAQALASLGTDTKTLVVGSMNPIPSGTQLKDDTDADPFTLPSDAWLFCVDPGWQTNMEHPAQWLPPWSLSSCPTSDLSRGTMGPFSTLTTRAILLAPRLQTTAPSTSSTLTLIPP
jgi:hypothetical protein